MDSFREERTNLINVGKSKVQIIGISRMTGYDFDFPPSFPDCFFQSGKGMQRELIIFCQKTDKTVPAVCSEPNGIAREKILVINQIDQVSPGMSGHKNCLDLNVVKIKNLPIFYKDFLVFRLYLGQLVKTVENLSAYFAG